MSKTNEVVCLRFDRSLAASPEFRAFPTAEVVRPASRPTIAITTKSSTKVKAGKKRLEEKVSSWAGQSRAGELSLGFAINFMIQGCIEVKRCFTNHNVFYLNIKLSRSKEIKLIPSLELYGFG